MLTTYVKEAGKQCGSKGVSNHILNFADNRAI